MPPVHGHRRQKEAPVRRSSRTGAIWFAKRSVLDASFWSTALILAREKRAGITRSNGPTRQAGSTEFSFSGSTCRGLRSHPRTSIDLDGHAFGGCDSSGGRGIQRPPLEVKRTDQGRRDRQGDHGGDALPRSGAGPGHRGGHRESDSRREDVDVDRHSAADDRRAEHRRRDTEHQSRSRNRVAHADAVVGVRDRRRTQRDRANRTREAIGFQAEFDRRRR